jgi:hypothetical protein
MSISDSHASHQYCALIEQSIDAGALLQHYALEDGFHKPEFNKNKTIREQRISLLSDMYYNALEGARTLDQGAGMRNLEKMFYQVAPQTVFTIRKPILVLKVLRTDPRAQALHADIINKPKGLRENIYSITHKHLEKNKDKSYAHSLVAQKMLGFLKFQCPSMIRQKRMQNFCRHMRKMIAHPDTEKIGRMLSYTPDM